MPTVYVTVGPPGAGKTTFVSWTLVAESRVSPNHILSPDALLCDREGYRWSKERVGHAWRSVQSDYQRMLVAGRDIVLDATSVQRSDRQSYVQAARQAGHRVVAIWFDVPLSVLIERDGAREEATKRVGEEVVRRFVDEQQPPALEEGFDEVWRVDLEGRVVERRP